MERSSEGGLGFGEADGVVVPGDHHDLHVAGDVLEVFSERLVLVVDVDDVEFLVLVGVDADALDHVARDEEVLDALGLGGVQPVGERLPGVRGELLAADVNVRDERGLNVAVRRVRVVRPGDLGEVDVVGEHDAAVVGQRPLDGNHFVQEEVVNEVRDVAVLHHERGEHAVRVLQFDEPVAARGRPHVVDHPDDGGVAAARHRLQRARRPVVHAPAQLLREAVVAVPEHRHEVLVLARPGGLARDVARDVDAALVGVRRATPGLGVVTRRLTPRRSTGTPGYDPLCFSWSGRFSNWFCRRFSSSRTGGFVR